MLFKKTTKQTEATNLQNSYQHVMLFGGSRSGKTAISIRNMVIRSLTKPSRHLVSRFRFNHVKQSIIYDTFPKVMRLAFPKVPFVLNKSDWFVSMPNGSEIWFGGLDDKMRVEKVLGNEYSTIFLNECTQISWDARNMVMSRLAENSGLRLLAQYDCNPASTKHWTHTCFKQGKTPEGELLPNQHQYASLQMNPRDNLTNLPPEYLTLLEGLPARQRRRFLDGEFQLDIEGALWNVILVEKAKCKPTAEFKKKVIGVDPAVTNKANSDTTGIILCGLDNLNEGWVLGDYSMKGSPNEWAQRVVNLYHMHKCAYVVVEVNQGGDMVKTILRNIDPYIPIKEVHASQGKFARAEPIAALYEQGRVGHYPVPIDEPHNLAALETEMCEYVPLNSTKSPDRLDALVWAMSDLMPGRGGITLDLV